MNKILRNRFDLFSEWVGDNLGKPTTFAMALITILFWAGFGPFTHYSETWQLIVNTGTTIATFLMVFLLQNTQNRDTAETHECLKELRKQTEIVMKLTRMHGEALTKIQLSLDK